MGGGSDGDYANATELAFEAYELRTGITRTASLSLTEVMALVRLYPELLQSGQRIAALISMLRLKNTGDVARDPAGRRLEFSLLKH